MAVSFPVKQEKTAKLGCLYKASNRRKSIIAAPVPGCCWHANVFGGGSKNPGTRREKRPQKNGPSIDSPLERARRSTVPAPSGGQQKPADEKTNDQHQQGNVGVKGLVSRPMAEIHPGHKAPPAPLEEQTA